MAYKYPITLFKAPTEQDAHGEVTGKPILWRETWAAATMSGGSRRTMAGRLASEHGVVLTTHWMPTIEECRWVLYEGAMRPIIDVVPEGYRKSVHVIIDVTDTDVAYAES